MNMQLNIQVTKGEVVDTSIGKRKVFLGSTAMFGFSIKIGEILSKTEPELKKITPFLKNFRKKENKKD